MAYCHLIVKLRMFLFYLKLFVLFCCQSHTPLYYNIGVVVIMQSLDASDFYSSFGETQYGWVFLSPKIVFLICGFVHWHFCFWILQKVNGTSESQLIKKNISPAFVQTTANWLTRYWYSIKCHKYLLAAYRHVMDPCDYHHRESLKVQPVQVLYQ